MKGCRNDARRHPQITAAAQEGSSEVYEPVPSCCGRCSHQCQRPISNLALCLQPVSFPADAQEMPQMSLEGDKRQGSQARGTEQPPPHPPIVIYLEEATVRYQGPFVTSRKADFEKHAFCAQTQHRSGVRWQNLSNLRSDLGSTITVTSQRAACQSEAPPSAQDVRRIVGRGSPVGRCHFLHFQHAQQRNLVASC